MLYTSSYLPEPDTRDILSLLGITGKTTGSEMRMKDPRVTCNDRSGHLYINLSNGLCMCHKCGWRGNAVLLYQELTGASSYGEAVKDIRKRTSVCLPEKKHYIPLPKRQPVAPIEKRDAVFRKFLKGLSLTPDHEKNLRKRGFFRVPGLYRSAPDFPDITKIMKTFRAEEVLGVPGFYEKDGSAMATQLKSGILVPYLDHNERIQGLQLRIDEAILKKNPKLSKYVWYSSAWASDSKRGSGGCGGSFAHWACDFHEGSPVFVKENSIGETVCGITEGAMKADIFHQLSGWPCIALAGVNCTKDLNEALSRLKKYGVQSIYNFFDMDFITNENVRKASEAIEVMILEHGMSYYRPTWDPKYKGIDDYLSSRVHPAYPKG